VAVKKIRKQIVPGSSFSYFSPRVLLIGGSFGRHFPTSTSVEKYENELLRATRFRIFQRSCWLEVGGQATHQSKARAVNNCENKLPGQLVFVFVHRHTGPRIFQRACG